MLEAAEKLNIPEDAVVINIQGDEPALEPKMLSELVQPFKSTDTRVTTLVRKTDPVVADHQDVVTVTFTKSGRALYFSRSVVPYPRKGVIEAVHEHIGMYAFRMDTLRKFVALGPGQLEKIEKLEQLRLLENDIPIHIVITEYESMDVDRPEDVEGVSRFLAQE